MATIYLTQKIVQALHMPEKIGKPHEKEVRIVVIDAPFNAVLRDDGKIYPYITNQDGESEEAGSAVPYSEESLFFLDDSDDSETVTRIMFVLYAMAMTFLKENDLLDKFDELGDDEGVLIGNSSGEPKAIFVAGKTRPFVTCLGLFGDTEFARPYEDEEATNLFLGYNDDVEEIEEQLIDVESPIAMRVLANRYYNGSGCDVNMEKALYWYERLTEYGCGEAMFNAGLMYMNGIGCKSDPQKAYKYMAMAVDYGDEDAVDLLPEFKIAAESMKDPDNATPADLGKLARLYANMKDYDKSLGYAKRATDLGDPEGMWVLALAYTHGRSVKKDEKKAFELYEKAADMGHAPSIHNLGSCYLDGTGVRKDHKRAFELFNEAAEKGYELSLKAIGHCYQFGYGVDDDMDKAIEWYEKYLENNEDEELEQKVMIFKSILGDDEFDSDEEDEEDYENAEAESENNFDIKNGVLIKYKGRNENVIIPAGITEIGCNAFAICDSLKSVTIPDGVKKIGYDAFMGCENLKRVIIPDSVIEIDNEVFIGCESLKNITIPNGVISIGSIAFAQCPELANITIPESVTKIADSAFNGSYNVTIHAPAGSYAERYAKKNNINFEAI